jgi:hypothetical protein
VSLTTAVPSGQGVDQYTQTQVAATSAAGVAAFHALHTANHAKHLAAITAAAKVVTVY